MPTVLRKNGFDFLIYTNDHLPGHVHIFKAGKEVIIDLGTADKAPTIREIVGMNRKDVVKALQIVFEYQDYLYHFGMNPSYYRKAKRLKELYFPQPLARYPQPKMVLLAKWREIHGHD